MLKHEMERKDAEIHNKDAEIYKKDAEIHNKDAEIRNKDAQIQNNEKEIQHQATELEALKSSMAKLQVQLKLQYPLPPKVDMLSRQVNLIVTTYYVVYNIFRSVKIVVISGMICCQHGRGVLTYQQNIGPLLLLSWMEKSMLQ